MTDSQHMTKMDDREDRPFDLIGVLQASQTLRWAIAGRSKSKLEAAKQKLVESEPSVAASVDAVVAPTRVIVSTVGPFLKYGQSLIDACVRLRTDYVDSAGEIPFVREMIDRYHQKASEDGTFIVTSCGFDCIPSDLGAFIVAHHLATKHGLKTSNIRFSLVDWAGAPSGGTLHSIAETFALPFSTLSKMNSLYYLADKEGPHQPEVTFSRYDKDLQKWQGFFIMESGNARYVYRSHSLLGNVYGDKLKYTETLTYRGPTAAFFKSMFTVFGSMSLLMPPGYFRVELVGESESKNGQSPTKCKGVVSFNRDPGYGAAGVMLAESALCLALDRKRFALEASSGFPGFQPVKGGVVTAASAMGMVLVDRLRKAGMVIDAEDLRAQE
ncbi:hypothetical protein HK102_004882 [Quaeritorhiza haematococci]|nr:hypothetical protein HK102_004882 [Quaeritorhiza haematococci]